MEAQSREEREAQYEELLTRPEVLRAACVEGRVEILRACLDRGVDVNATGARGRKPLHFACWMGRFDAATLLLDRGADVDPADEYGYSPLMAASGFCHADLVTLLIDRGADVNWTAYAAGRKSKQAAAPPGL